MSTSFSKTLSALRQDKGVSQRVAAGDLGISQALLSHYENGIREPGLDFVTRACAYYNVSADYLLGRSTSIDGISFTGNLPLRTAENSTSFQCSELAKIDHKLLADMIYVVLDLIGKTGNHSAIGDASAYIGLAIYKIFRIMYEQIGEQDENFLSDFDVPFTYETDAASKMAELSFVKTVTHQIENGGFFPNLAHETLAMAYPEYYHSLLQGLYNINERIENI